MKDEVSAKVVNKIRKLAQLAGELRRGQQFSITRLTTIKSLCEDRQAAAHFALHLVELVRNRVNKWHMSLTAEAVRRMKRHVKNPTDKSRTVLRVSLRKLEGIQNEYRKIHWSQVRIIRYPQALIVEHALRSIISPVECPFWVYHAARAFAEQSDESGLSGLVAKSAPMVEEIADFWCRYYFGKCSRRWLELQG